MNIWEHIKPQFDATEKWGNPNKMCGYLLWCLKAIRMSVKYPMIIHNGVEPRPANPSSYHPRGMAVDWHVHRLTFPKAIVRVEEAIVDLGIADFVGLGVYPEWTHPGFHLDIRGYKARWGLIGSDYLSYDLVRSKIF